MTHAVNRKIKSNEVGTCPFCESENIEYGTHAFDNDNLYFNVRCLACGSHFKEWHFVEFIGNTGLQNHYCELKVGDEVYTEVEEQV